MNLNLRERESENFLHILYVNNCPLFLLVAVDYLPIIAGLAAVAVVVLMVVGGLVYSSHYRRTHMGHYTLKDMLPFRRNNHVL